jgi:hypothetical protein
MNTVAELVFPLAHWRNSCTSGEGESRPDLSLASLTAAWPHNRQFSCWNGKGLHGKNLLTRRFTSVRVSQTTPAALPLFVRYPRHIVLVSVAYEGYCFKTPKIVTFGTGNA